MNIVEINSLDDHRIKDFLSLKKIENKIVCESQKVLHKLIKKNISINKILVEDNFFNNNKNLFENLNTNIFVVNKNISSNIVGYKLHKGVIAITDMLDYFPLEKLGETIILLNGLTSPENVGSIVRTSMGFGIDSLIYDEKTVSPYMRRCIRVSTGNVLNQRIHKSKNILQTIKKLKQLNYQIISTANTKDSLNLTKFKSLRKKVIIIGSEGHGIEKEVLKASDDIVKIPVSEEVEHYNASISASIVMYHITQFL